MMEVAMAVVHGVPAEALMIPPASEILFPAGSGHQPGQPRAPKGADAETRSAAEMDFQV